MDKETKKEFQQLGRMIKKGFDENTKHHKQTNEKLFKLEQGQEKIRSRLDQVAYSFEVRDLEKRVRRCETKLGITY